MAIRTNWRSGYPLRRCRAVLVGLIGLAIMAAMTGAGMAQQNRIESVSIVSESADTVTFEIIYEYAGDQGDRVSVSVYPAQDGERLSYYRYRAGPVRRGRHRTQVAVRSLERAPDMFSTNQVEFGMFVAGGAPFLSRTYAFAKTWSRPRAGLTAVPNVAPPPQIAGNFGILLANPQIREMQAVDPPGRPGDLSGGPPDCDISGMALGGPSKRRVLSDGSIELTYPDGTVLVRSENGGETITCPNGGTLMQLPNNAQPSTPPSAPPDAIHAAWVEVELERQLEVIRMLVGYDRPSVEHYLSREGAGLSPYRRISQRTLAIDMLVRP